MHDFVFILVLVLLPLVLACLFLLVYPARKHDTRDTGLAEMVDRLLPQTQCQACGYPGCRPYAEAIIRGEADINQCPPGGTVTIRLIAELLGRDPKHPDPAYGAQKQSSVAVIDEQACIGCVKCIRACPVDAIIGAPKQMHTVVAGFCTGCELCIEPCPVDCITMVTADTDIKKWIWSKPHLSAEYTG
ncbi:MAG: electron transport complex subunit RsxB [Gammaproteobacteria bacterium]